MTAPNDFLDIAECLSDTELLLQKTVRRFVQDQVAPNISNWFDRGVFPQEMIKEIGALGLLGMHLKGYGCSEASAVDYGLACMELEAGDSALRSFVSVQGSLAMFPIRAYGSEEQKQQYLPAMAAGNLVGCFGLTEPDSGSDPSNMRTTAKRDGDDWILNGTKLWITNGGIADVAVVWAKDTSSGRVRGFLVPKGAKGFTARDVPAKLSLRASVTSELAFDSVRLPNDSVLPGVDGMRGPLSCLNEARYGILWGAAGAGPACYEIALEYAGTRTQFERPIAGFQLTQQKLVEMMTTVNMGTLLALHLGRMKDDGRLAPAQVSFGKRHNVQGALRVAREARGILGANGITVEFGVMRHAANLESVSTYEGTNEIHTLILGEAITGLNAFRG